MFVLSKLERHDYQMVGKFYDVTCYAVLHSAQVWH